jgi:hypothetical protein
VLRLEESLGGKMGMLSRSGKSSSPLLDVVKKDVLKKRMGIYFGHPVGELLEVCIPYIIGSTASTTQDMIGILRLPTTRACIIILKGPFYQGGANATVMRGMLSDPPLVSRFEVASTFGSHFPINLNRSMIWEPFQPDPFRDGDRIKDDFIECITSRCSDLGSSVPERPAFPIDVMLWWVQGLRRMLVLMYVTEPPEGFGQPIHFHIHLGQPGEFGVV